MVYRKDLEMQIRWSKLINHLEKQLGKRPRDLNGVLFLIGLQELGKGPQAFSKEEKQDLIHLGICKVLSLAGYYELEGLDGQGWPHWKLIKKLPRIHTGDQEKLLKIQVLDYFDKEVGVSIN